MTRLVIGFIRDLTDPNSESIDVGILRIRDNRFVSFEWTRDVAPLMTDALTSEILRTPKPWQPETIARFASFTQVFGHTPCKAPVVVPGHYVALDTGCGTCPPYSLSALVLSPDGRVETMTVR